MRHTGLIKPSIPSGTFNRNSVLRSGNNRIVARDIAVTVTSGKSGKRVRHPAIDQAIPSPSGTFNRASLFRSGNNRIVARDIAVTVAIYCLTATGSVFSKNGINMVSQLIFGKTLAKKISPRKRRPIAGMPKTIVTDLEFN
ncbi:MAG UNVERIFIED_CONTAM: hypothetical protein LVR29_07260 [Microcystis novacekii LVE1205-3]